MTGSLATIVLIGLTVLLAAGLALMLWGLIGIRIGTDPHCRKCKYNLTGLQADKCPECGRPASGKNVRIGLGKRRHLPLYIGLTLLAVSLAGFGSVTYFAAKRGNLQAYLPGFALRWQAESGDLRAVNELQRRLQAGTIKGASLDKVVSLALQQQGLYLEPNIGSAWARLLATADLAGHLTQAQREQFRDQIAQVTLEFRPTVLQGEDVQINVGYLIRGAPGVTGSFTIFEGEVAFADQRRPYKIASSADLGGWGRSMVLGYPFATADLTPGKYKVEFHAIKAFGSPIFDRPIHLTATLEVLPADAPDTVRLITNPGMAGTLRRAFQFSAANPDWSGDATPGRIPLTISVAGRVPIDCAFDVFARIGEQEQLIGALKVRKSDMAGMMTQYSVRFDPAKATTIVPIFRTDADLARGTTDMFDIWDGELVFDVVPVPQPTPAPAVQKTDAVRPAAPPPATQPAATE